MTYCSEIANMDENTDSSHSGVLSITCAGALERYNNNRGVKKAQIIKSATTP